MTDRSVATLVEETRIALESRDLTSPQWTHADIVSARLVGGGRKRMVGELGWQSARIPFVVADRAAIWKVPQSGQVWKAGLSGLFLIRLTVHPRFGFQAEVFDCLVESLEDSSSQERVAALARRLKTERWAIAQRQLEIPKIPCRIGVVSSDPSAGFSDFLRTIDDAFLVRLEPAVMSGAAAVESVPRAIAAASGRADLVVVLRGGGAASGMEWANDERVVRAVATCPVPVWTAIGHATDRHLIDEVAQRAFATPSQVGSDLTRRLLLESAQADLAAAEGAKTMAVRESAIQARRARRAQLILLVFALGVALAAVAIGLSRLGW